MYIYSEEVIDQLEREPRKLDIFYTKKKKNASERFKIKDNNIYYNIITFLCGWHGGGRLYTLAGRIAIQLTLSQDGRKGCSDDAGGNVGEGVVMHRL